MEGVRGETVTSADDAGAPVSRACEVPDVSYNAFLAAQDDGCHWAGPDGLEIAGAGAAVRFAATGPDRLDRIRSAADSVFANADLETPAAARPRLLGGCAFFDDHEPTGPWSGFPSARFVLPSVQLTRSGGTTWLTVTRSGPDAGVDAVERDLATARRDVESLPAMVPSGGRPGVERTRRTTSCEEWIEGVERATDRIADGDLVKVVLALALEADLETAVVAADQEAVTLRVGPPQAGDHGRRLAPDRHVPYAPGPPVTAAREGLPMAPTILNP